MMVAIHDQETVLLFNFCRENSCKMTEEQQQKVQSDRGGISHSIEVEQKRVLIINERVLFVAILLFPIRFLIAYLVLIFDIYHCG